MASTMALTEIQDSEGWRNITKFTKLTLSRLAKSEQQLVEMRVRALDRALRRAQRRVLEDAFKDLVLDSAIKTSELNFSGKTQTEAMLHRMTSILDSFENCYESGFSPIDLNAKAVHST